MRTGNSPLGQPSFPLPVCPGPSATSSRGRLSGAGAGPRQQGRGSSGRPGRLVRRSHNDLVDYRTPTYLSHRYWRFRDWSRTGNTNWGLSMNIPTDLFEEDDDRSDVSFPTTQLNVMRNLGKPDKEKETKIVNANSEKKNGEKNEEKEEEEEVIPPGFRWVTIEIV